MTVCPPSTIQTLKSRTGEFPTPRFRYLFPLPDPEILADYRTTQASSMPPLFNRSLAIKSQNRLAGKEKVD